MTYSPVTLESLLAHQGWALRIARRLVREEGEAEDLVQRTWMAALRSPPQSETGARAWIRKVILNLARERHRRNQTRVRHERIRETSEVDPTDMLESLSRTEIHRLLGERLMKLDEPYRTVVLQRFYEDLTSVEIAQRLGIPAGTVRWRLKMGLDQLRAELDRRSQGDRTRWVSALLAFVSPAAAPAEPTREARVGAPAGAGLPHPLAWVALGAVGLLGVVLLRESQDRPGEALAAASVELAPVPVPTRTTEVPDLERTPVASGPAAPAPSTPPRGLALRVEDPSGAPVPGASILVARADGFERRARSDEDGRAWLAVAPADVGALGLPATHGRVSVRALATGRVASELVHVSPPFAPEHEVRLVVGGPDARLRGLVRAGEGPPVAGAIVAWFVPLGTLEQQPEGDFTSPSYLSVTSDAEGRFELANLALGKGNIACFAPGFAPHAIGFDIAVPDSEVELRLERGATLTGIVRLPGGAPAEGARVSFEAYAKSDEWATGLPHYNASWRGFVETTRTDAQGAFRLEAVNASAVQRMVWAVDEERGLVATTTLRLENGVALHWDAELAERPGLQLRFVDEAGEPLVGWLAHVRRPIENAWWIRRVFSDEAGRVRVLDCPEGDLYLDLLPPFGIGPSHGWRRLRASDEEQLVQIDTHAMASIAGRALDALGAPELNGELVAFSLDTTHETMVERDPDGAFRQPLTPGIYALILRLDHTAKTLSTFRLKRAEARQLGDLVAPPMGSLRILEAEHAGPEPAPSYALFKIGATESEKRSMLVGHGRLEREVHVAVFPGRYRVLFHGEGGRPGRSSIVQVRAHEETRLAAPR